MRANFGDFAILILEVAALTERAHNFRILDSVGELLGEGVAVAVRKK